MIQLVALRPLSILALGFAITQLDMDQVRKHRFLLSMAAACAALPALQLVPLPPGIWGQLPGRALVSEIDLAAGLGPIWRPLTMTPKETWNALFACAGPVAALLLSMQISPRDRRRTAALLIAIFALSALIGIAQIQGPADGPLYFYPITNNGSAVGLFANRNHQALMLALMLPMLAAYAAGRSAGVVALSSFGALLVLPLLMITGSRAGVLTAAIGVIGIPFILSAGRNEEGQQSRVTAPERRRLRSRIWIALILCAVSVLALTVGLDRDVALGRLVRSDVSEDLRTAILPIALAMTKIYFPVGSGMGSFERVFQIFEPDELLTPKIVNHAHNDWLEVVLTGGAPAALLLGICIAAYVTRAIRLFRYRAHATKAHRESRLGMVMLMQIAVASIGDYPLRTPALAVVFAVACFWAACLPARSQA